MQAVINFSQASFEQVQLCAKYAGVDEIYNIHDKKNRKRMILVMKSFGYKKIDISDPNWIVPIK